MERVIAASLSTERILEKGYPFLSTSTRSTAYVKLRHLHSKTGIDYAFYESKRSKGVDVEYVLDSG